MKKPSEVLVREQEVESLKLRVAKLERTTAAMSARMIHLFGPTPKHVDVVPVGAARPAGTPAVH